MTSPSHRATHLPCHRRTGRFAPDPAAPPFTTFFTVFFTVFFTLLLAGAPPARAWTRTCLELCHAVTSFQSYGTGNEDTTCFAACNDDRSAGICRRLWYDYFACVDGGSSMSLCWQLYGDAKECSVCDLGQVSGSWSAADLLFVNPGCVPNTDPNAPPGYAPSGTYDDPLCHFHDGIERAITRQKTDQSTRVLVCEGTYREGHQDVTGVNAASTGTAKVLVEAVVKGNAVVAGSEDWSGAWLPQTLPVQSVAHNQLLHSTNPSHPAAWATSSGVAVQPAASSVPPPNLPPAPVFNLATTGPAGELDPLFLYQVLPLLEDRSVTFSVYLRPQGTDQFRLELRRWHSDLLPGQQGSGGAWYNFQLPPGQDCDPTVASKAATGFGVESVGGGWYRVHVTQPMDHDPGSPDPAQGLAMVRLHLVGPLAAGQGADIFAPQLDYRPLSRFATAPRTYVPTTAAQDSLQSTTWKTFYVNDPAQQTWTHDWGLARRHPEWKNLPPLMRRSEMVFLDGQPLRQELSRDDMEPGSFFGDDGIVYGGFNFKDKPEWVPGQCSPTQPCPITILPPPGTNMADALVEVAAEPRLLWLTESARWTIRGLTFRHSTGAYDAVQQGDCPADPADCIEPLNNSAVALINSRDLTLLENRLEWNNAYGLGVGGVLAGSNIRLERNVVADNGVGGETFGSAWGFTVEGEDLLRNNWRGARALVRGHGTTGAKYSYLADGTFRSVVALGNFGSGIWFDTESQAITVSECAVADNAGAGIYFEANDDWKDFHPDPTTVVVDCVFEGNEVGVQGISSSDIEIEGNLFLENDHGISLDGTPRPVPNPAPGQQPFKNLRDWTIRGNTIVACEHQDWMRFGDGRPAGVFDHWRPVMESLTSDDNDLSHPQGIGARGFWLKGIELTLPEWQGCDEEEDPWCAAPQDAGSQIIP